MEITRIGQWLSLLICVLLLLQTEGVPVGITFVENAVAKGAGEKFLLFLLCSSSPSPQFSVLFIVVWKLIYV